MRGELKNSTSRQRLRCWQLERWLPSIMMHHVRAKASWMLHDASLQLFFTFFLSNEHLFPPMLWTLRMQEFLRTFFLNMPKQLLCLRCLRVGGSFTPPDLFAPRLSSNSERSGTRMHTVDIDMMSWCVLQFLFTPTWPAEKCLYIHDSHHSKKFVPSFVLLFPRSWTSRSPASSAANCLGMSQVRRLDGVWGAWRASPREVLRGVLASGDQTWQWKIH